GDDRYAHLPDGPDAREEIADFLAGMAREAPAELRRFLADGAGQPAVLRVIARVPALDTARSQALFDQIREAARRVALPDVSLTGTFVVFSNMSTTLVHHQVQGLAVALLLIVAVVALRSRAPGRGLLWGAPTGARALGGWGWGGGGGSPVGAPPAMIASVAIGTIVDNSIYLLARFRDAFARQPDYVEALTAMVYASGRAVVFSTVTLAGGVWVGVFSSFVPTVRFSLLTGAPFPLG